MKILIKGCEALGKAAIKAGCHAFFGYPITPQTEIVAYLSEEMPKRGRLIIQAESEISAINMVYGASSAGFRVMTSTSSPGMSLKSEGISYMAGAELPCVIVNVCRLGPGLGGIQPSQQDYFAATRSLGHGGFKVIAIAPNSVQEIYDLTIVAFELADKYRNPVIIFLDGTLGQMMESIEIDDEYDGNCFSIEEIRKLKPWGANGVIDRGYRNIIRSLYLDNDQVKSHMKNLRNKYSLMKESEVNCEIINLQNQVDIILVCFGIVSRICEKVRDILIDKNISVGIIRPVTIWPFPYDEIRKYSNKTKYGFLCVEMNFGQMVEDVILGCGNKCKVYSCAEVSGSVIDCDIIIKDIEDIIKGDKYEYEI